MKKWVKITLCSLLAVVVLAAVFVGGMVLYSKNYAPDEQVQSVVNTTGLVQAYGKSL